LDIAELDFKIPKKTSFCVQDTMARRPADPEEELRWMSQEVRGYVEAVLNSLAANVPKVSWSSFYYIFSFCERLLITFVIDQSGSCSLPS
jgi:hypothetical protein